MSATDYTTLIAKIRLSANDTATANFHPGETPMGLRNGTNKVFRLANTNPVAASMYLTYGSTVRSASGFSILDAPSGYIEMTSAPDASTTQPFYFDYFHQWFVDADYNTMIDEATEALGESAGVATPEGLYPALIQYALSRFWIRRASQYANVYATRGGPADARPESVTQQFLNLSKEAEKRGQDLRDAYYKRFGKRAAPASGTVTLGSRPYTPRK
jgi:hypothetical protein